MKFRTQILLAFVPIFALLGLSGEAVRAWLETRELRWGLEEQASSLAVAIAEFLRGQEPSAASAGRDTPAWTGPLETVIRSGEARRVLLLGSDGHRLLGRFGAALPGDAAPAVPADVRQRLDREPWVPGVPVTRADETTWSAWAPWRTERGDLAGFVRVEIGAEAYPRALAAEKRRLATGGVLSVLAGLLAAGLIVVPVARGLADLRASAERARAGHPLAPPTSRFLREIVDLGESFGTMGNLLTEAMDKARRTLIENEQLRTAGDLAHTFRTQFDPPALVDFAAVEVATRVVGLGAGGAFAGCREVGGTVWAFVGEVPAPDALQQATLASAAKALVEDNLGRLPPDAAFADAAALLPIAGWECVAWPASGGHPRRWAGRAALCTVPGIAVPEGSPALCLHTFGPSQQRVIDACLAGFGDRPAADLADQLARLLGADADGVFVLLRGKAPRNRAAPGA